MSVEQQLEAALERVAALRKMIEVGRAIPVMAYNDELREVWYRRAMAAEGKLATAIEALDDSCWLNAEVMCWMGECDHDVGICYCADRRRVEQACETLAKLKGQAHGRSS